VTEGLTIQEAAETTGWSARMLRYIEDAGLVRVGRTPSGYRVYGPGELQRLRTLRELLARFDCALSDVAFARRMTSEPELREALGKWFEARPERPEGLTSDDWLRWEQQKHQRLLAAAAEPPPPPKETAAA
jgi:MerR family copper efflux transcriptional regulator